jgi:hypothetical protein
MRRNITQEWERTMFSSTQNSVQATLMDETKLYNKIMEERKTNTKMCIALISDNAAAACIVNRDLDNYMGYAPCNIIF